MNVIEALIAYVDKDADVAGLLAAAEERIGDDRLRILAIKLLAWMKAQHRSRKLRPLTLADDFTWCNDLRHVLRYDDTLTAVFAIKDHTLNFVDSLPTSERLALCETVDSRYRPPLMT